MNININGNNEIVINGSSYMGNSVSIKNGAVYIDGVQQEQQLGHNIIVAVHGDVESLDLGSGSVAAQNVGHITSGSGDVTCETVKGDVRTGSGDVTAVKIEGSVRTGSGDVIHAG